MGRWGKFITFEGIDGSGKSTILKGINRRLIESGIDNSKILSTYEPGGTEFSDMIKHALSSTVEREPMSELFALLSSRYEHTKKVIIPALRDGKIILCDRYSDSTIAYQVFGKGIEYYLATRLNKLASLSLKPKLTILIDVPPEVAIERLRYKNNEDYFERLGLEFFRKVRYGYLALAKRAKKRIKVVDGTKGIDEVLNQAWEHVKKVVFDG